MRRPTSVFSVWSPFRRRSTFSTNWSFSVDRASVASSSADRLPRSRHHVIGVVETTEFLENGFELVRDGWRLFRKPRDILAGFLERHAIGIEPGTQLRRRRARRVDGFELGAQILELLPAGFEPGLSRLRLAGRRFHTRETFRHVVDLGAPP